MSDVAISALAPTGGRSWRRRLALGYRRFVKPTTTLVGTLQLATIPLVALALIVDVSWRWWLVALAGYFLYACIGVTVGYHRYFAHRSFKAGWWAEWLFLACGVLGGSGTPASWVAMHRHHHRHADTRDDPHAPSRHGLSVMLIGRYGAEENKWRMRRMLEAFPGGVWLQRHYGMVVVAFALLLLAVDWRLFLFGWAVPVCAKLWISGATIFFTHVSGYRNFPTGDRSGNVWLLGLLAWGEGWHNNHHARPGRWNFAHRWWEVDVGAWVIRLVRLVDRILSAVGGRSRTPALR